MDAGNGITLPEARKLCLSEDEGGQAVFLLSHFEKGTQFHNWLSAEMPVSPALELIRYVFRR
jgi:hypothetical protein